MSKRILAVLLAVGVLGSSSAFASRARLSVMGTGDGGVSLGYSSLGANTNSEFTNGSYYYDDAYNMFYNPSAINDYGSFAIVEKDGGNTGNGMGGFTTGISSVKIGLFTNRGDAVHPGAATGAPIDLIVGTEMSGIKLGLGLTWASQYQENTAKNATPFTVPAGQKEDRKQQQLIVRAGVNVSNLDVFGHIQAIGKNETSFTGTDQQGSVGGYGVGTRYKFGEWTPYAAFRKATSEATVAAGAAKVKRTNRSSWGLGLGRNATVSEGVRLNYAISYWRSFDLAAGNNQNFTRNQIPLDISAEGDVLSWLTIRAGLTHRIWDRHNISAAGGNANVAFSSDTLVNTTGRFGATFKIGRVDLDWAVGAGAAGTENLDQSTFGFDGGVFTNASLTYRM